jgi:hypothetical protein
LIWQRQVHPPLLRPDISPEQNAQQQFIFSEVGDFRPELSVCGYLALAQPESNLQKPPFE